MSTTTISKSAKKDVAEIVGALAIIVAVVWLLFAYAGRVLDAPDGAKVCRQELAKKYPSVLDSAIIVQTVWTRTLADHWVAALLMQSKNLGEEQAYTAVCHFKGKTLAFDRLEWFVGDRIAALKRMSVGVAPTDYARPVIDWGVNPTRSIDARQR